MTKEVDESTMPANIYRVTTAVLGECCDRPHIKYVTVVAENESIAAMKAKEYLEQEGFDVGDILVTETPVDYALNGRRE